MTCNLETEYSHYGCCCTCKHQLKIWVCNCSGDMDYLKTEESAENSLNENHFDFGYVCNAANAMDQNDKTCRFMKYKHGVCECHTEK